MITYQVVYCPTDGQIIAIFQLGCHVTAKKDKELVESAKALVSFSSHVTIMTEDELLSHLLSRKGHGPT